MRVTNTPADTQPFMAPSQTSLSSEDQGDFENVDIHATSNDHDFTKVDDERGTTAERPEIRLTPHEQATAAEPSAGFGAWLMSLIDRLTGVFGHKMGATAMNSSLEQIFCENAGWKQAGSRTADPFSGQSFSDFHYKQANDTTYVITRMAHDLKIDPKNNEICNRGIRSGGKSIPDVLDSVKTNLRSLPESSNLKILIPVAQANDLGPFGPRGHFTLLEVDAKNDNGNIKISKATLHDPKGGLLDYAYDGLAHVTQRLRETTMLSNDFSPSVEHHGHQSLLNGNDCGRFTAYYAHEIADKGSLEKSTREEAKKFFGAKFSRPKP